MPIYALAAFAVIGAFAGWLGGMLLKGRGLGLIVNTIVGVIGAFTGECWSVPLSSLPQAQWDHCSRQQSLPLCCWSCWG